MSAMMPRKRRRAGSRSLLADETYVGGLRDLLGEFRPRALLILDEAHHAAPASGSPAGIRRWPNASPGGGAGAGAVKLSSVAVMAG